MKSALLLLLRAYKLCISPYLGQNCRFYPSCSDYASQAVAEHGAARGGLLAAKRLCKCHPWHPGGLDPVPEKPLPPAATVSASACGRGHSRLTDS